VARIGVPTAGTGTSVAATAGTPAAVVSAGTTPDERVVTAPLGAIARAAEGLPTPALVVIGEVVALRASLRAVRRSAA